MYCHVLVCTSTYRAVPICLILSESSCTGFQMFSLTQCFLASGGNCPAHYLSPTSESCDPCPTVMGRPAGLEARAGRRDQRSFPMNASARTEMEADSVHFCETRSAFCDARSRACRSVSPYHVSMFGNIIRESVQIRFRPGAPG